MIVKYICSDDVEVRNMHWDYCATHFIPYIAIYREINNDYTTISYDLFTCHPIPIDLVKLPDDEISQLYNSYIKFFAPQIEFAKICDSFRVLPPHSEIIANQLFDYLIKFTKTNTATHIEAFIECMSSLFQNTTVLRNVFDVGSPEFKSCDDNDRETILMGLVSSKFKFQDILMGYTYFFRDDKPDTTRNFSDGLDHNYNSLCNKYQHSDDLRFDKDFQAPIYDKINYLEDKIKSILND